MRPDRFYIFLIFISLTISIETQANSELLNIQLKDPLSFQIGALVNQTGKRGKTDIFGTFQLPLKKHLGIFHRFWSNTADSFIGENLYYQGAAFGSTFLLSASGADRSIQDYFQKDPIGKDFGTGAVVIGAVWQPIIGGILYYSDDPKTKTAGSAVLQAAMIQAGYVTLLKGLTGRPDPIEGGDLANKQDAPCGNSSDSKAFFQMIDGCTWPSGHSSSAFSLVSTLYAFYPEKKWIAYSGYPAALAIGLGMVEADEHWFSDIVAGAFIGHVIGWTIGTNFRKDFNQINNDSARSSIQQHFVMPLVSSNGIGFIYQYNY